MATGAYTELPDSQQPALQLLQKLGYQYLSPEQSITERDELRSNVILENTLRQQLKAINRFTFKGATYPFSDGNIESAIHALKNVQDDGLVKTNQSVYELLTLGKSFEETIGGDKKSFSLHYIDWDHLENNTFHVVPEFEVDGAHYTRRPDLVLFVNGIPFVTIENKRRDKKEALEQAISQTLRNQRPEEGIPRLFHYIQLVMAVQPNGVKYATVGTEEKFWSYWKEREDADKEIARIINNDRPPENQRAVTEQDRMLYALCRPERLMEITYQFVVYDGPIKKVPRYQQYFSVHNTLERVKSRDEEGRRKGGVIWHTQGSGKSLTMVMLSKAIELDAEITQPRVIIVTDRVSLDKQIFQTFHYCGKEPIRARTGSHLFDVLEAGSAEVITTVLDKFDAALNNRDYVNTDPNIFVLIDESHRSQYGLAHARMRKVMPNACYIGFTGTPLMKKEKSTAQKFGGFIDRYTIDQAVKDKAVLPLLYEGRAVGMDVWKGKMDKAFEQLSEPLNEMQQKDLKKKYGTVTQILKSEQVIAAIARDIKQHYCQNWQGSGFKGQLAVPDKKTAIQYLEHFDKETNPALKLNARVVISPPDQREGYDDVYDDPKEKVQRFWDKTVKKFSSADQYEDYVIDKFKSDSKEAELLIVVSKLLTGFDAPRNTILYLAKPLEGHNLLQAIARVNRVFPGKDYGYIIDYVNVLEDLDKALTSYSALQEFDEEDLAGTVMDIKELVHQLPQKWRAVWDVLKEVKNKDDNEAIELFLADEERRHTFYEHITDFAKTLQAALSSEKVLDHFTEYNLQRYKDDLKRFQSIRRSVQLRYAERIDFREYEERVRKLMDTYIGADDVETIIPELDIFNEELLKRAVEEMTGSEASKADAIAHKMKKVINEKMEEDPVFYKRFSKLVEDAIKQFQNKWLADRDYLKKVLDLRDEFVAGHYEGMPNRLENKPEARAYYGILKENLHPDGHEDWEELMAEAGISLQQIIEDNKIVDWKRNEDVQKEMKNEIEDYLLGLASEKGFTLEFEVLDKILDLTIQVAKTR